MPSFVNDWAFWLFIKTILLGVFILLVINILNYVILKTGYELTAFLRILLSLSLLAIVLYVLTPVGKKLQIYPPKESTKVNDQVTKKVNKITNKLYIWMCIGMVPGTLLLFVANNEKIVNYACTAASMSHVMYVALVVLTSLVLIFSGIYLGYKYSFPICKNCEQPLLPLQKAIESNKCPKCDAPHNV